MNLAADSDAVFRNGAGAAAAIVYTFYVNTVTDSNVSQNPRKGNYSVLGECELSLTMSFRSGRRSFIIPRITDSSALRRKIALDLKSLCLQNSLTSKPRIRCQQ